MSTKGQLTLLVIVGMLLLFSVVLIISVQSILLENQLQAQAEEAVTEFIQQNSIDQYVTSCIERVSVEGLRLLGRQGGVIYESQGGLTPNGQEGVDFINYTNPDNVTAAVHYAIRDVVNCPTALIYPVQANLEQEATGDYPVADVFFENYMTYYMYPSNSFIPGCNGISPRVSIMSGYLGANELPKLCAYNGSNRYERGSNVVSCNLLHYDSPFEPISMQRQLEAYITHNMESCVDFSIYEQELANLNITVQQENVRVQSVFQAPRGIQILLDYPFTVQIPGSTGVFQSAQFQTSLDSNFKSLYTFMYNYVLEALRNPYFNSSSNYSDILGWSPGMTLERVRNACTNCSVLRANTDDILVFTDASSILLGEEFYFQIASYQRKPILNYVHDGTQTAQYNGTPLNFMFLSNASVEFFPEGMDPDEDNITFTYFGWREDYLDWFNYTKCLQEQCTLENHHEYIVRIENATNELSNSPHFIRTGRSAGPIETNESDIGYHEIQILIEDEHGARDFQTVRFLVFDIPVAKLTGENPYSDINDSFASFEDNYTLDGSASTASVLLGGQISQFNFRDDIEGFGIATPDNKLILPLGETTFSNITLGEFKASLGPQPHTITLSVLQDDATGTNSVTSAPAAFEVQVVECLPHQYDPNLPYFYPTGSVTNQPYTTYWGYSLEEQPHVCCEPINPLAQPLEGGDIKDSTQTCFDTDWLIDDYISCFPFNQEALLSNRAHIDTSASFITPLSQETYPWNFDQDIFGGIANLEISKFNNEMNNLFTVDHSQQCSGYRGNTCGGRLDVNWDDSAYECSDFTLPGQFARCEGPSTGITQLTQASCQAINVDQLSGTPQCESYDSGESFEKDFLGVNANNPYNYGSDAALIAAGKCAPDTTARLDFTTNPPSIDTLSGNFQCAATCGGDTGCEYHDLSQCACETQNICSGLSANDFITSSGDEAYYCVGPTACSSTCQASNTPITTEEACQCQTNPGSGKHEVGAPVPNWFNGYQSTQGTNTFCCSGTNTLTLQQANLAGTVPTCFKGEIKQDNTVFTDPTYPGASLLSCNGQLFYCGSNSGPLPQGVRLPLQNQNPCARTCQNNVWQ